MRCFICNGVIQDGDSICMNCGADLRLYQKIIHLSNRYYNAGLYKARVRDLSGAADCLKQSLKLNKMNIQARNLLGLVYYESGETVRALAQWVISTNLQPKKNIANSYLNEVQTNNTKLDLVDQMAKKYNQSLTYCYQGSDDLAIIQLKKVLSMNPKLVKGHQLLALLYIKQEDYGKAKKELRKAQQLDMNNTTTLNYMKEIISIEKSHQGGSKKREDRTSYQSGNELIIQPTEGYLEHSAMYTIVYILAGLLVGIALMWFLVLPARTQSIRSELNQTTVELGDQISAKSATIDSQQQQIEDLQQQVKDAQSETESQKSGVNMYDLLLKAQSESNAGDAVAAQATLAQVDTTVLSDNGKELYNTLTAAVNETAFSTLLSEGKKAFDSGDYETALNDFTAIVTSNEGYQDGEALYYYARSLHKSGDTDNAATQYQKVIDTYPDTKIAQDSQTYLDEIQNKVQ